MQETRYQIPQVPQGIAPGGPWRQALSRLLGRGRLAREVGSVVSSPWKATGLRIERQAQTQWCWAAVGVGLSSLYDSAMPRRQCEVVSSEFGDDTCCSHGAANQCNKPWYLDRVLRRLGYLDSIIRGAVSYQKVREEIETGRPVAIRVGWSGGGAHFLAIDAFNDHGETLGIEDSWYGRSEVTFADLSFRYQQTGSWSDTFLTRPRGAPDGP